VRGCFRQDEQDFRRGQDWEVGGLRETQTPEETRGLEVGMDGNRKGAARPAVTPYPRTESCDIFELFVEKMRRERKINTARPAVAPYPKQEDQE